MILAILILGMLAFVSGSLIRDPSTPEAVIDNQWLIRMKKTATMDDMIQVERQFLEVSSNQVKTTKVTIGDEYKLLIVKDCPKQFLMASMSAMEPNVAYIEMDQTVSALSQANDACAVQRDDVPWGISRINHADANHNDEFDHDATWGNDVDAYIIDTGIYIEHNDFGGRAVWGDNFVDNSDSDGNGHGTHVASTTGGTVYGVSKGAKLIAVKVLSAGGSGSWAGVIQGIEYTTTEHKKSNGKSVANMSLGGGFLQSVNDAVDASTGEGVVHVIAAGNSNNNACTLSPASAESGISVVSTALAGVGADRSDQRSFFSSYGPCTQIAAPGSDIKAAWIGNPTATRTISGTSMAAPHVCGVVTQILDSMPPNQDPAEVLKVLESSDYSQDDVIDMNCNNDDCNATPNKLVHIECS